MEPSIKDKLFGLDTDELGMFKKLWLAHTLKLPSQLTKKLIEIGIAETDQYGKCKILSGKLDSVDFWDIDILLNERREKQVRNRIKKGRLGHE